VTDNQQTLQHAIQAIQYGDRASCKRLLAQLLQADPQNVQAWLWMSEVADTDKQRHECLRRVVAIEPQNKGARARLAQLEARATVHAAPQRRRTRRQIILAGGLALSLFCGLILLIYTLVAVMPRAQARAERLSESYPQTATLWCPSCAQADEPVLLKTSLGAGLFGGPVGELEHGTPVAILDYRWSPLERRYYTEVSADGQRGWVPETILRQ
jgi:Tfp pilus assembly protein PilF